VDGVAIGSEEPLQIDPAELARRMSDPALSHLAEVGLGTPEQLLATFVAADDALRAWVADAPLITDDNPRVEQFNRYPRRLFRFADIEPHAEPVDEYLTSPFPDPEGLARSREAMHKLFAQPPDYDGALAAQPNDAYFRELVEERDYAASHAADR
jgi:spermidine synthase